MTDEQVPAGSTGEGPAENELLRGVLLEAVRDALGAVPPGTLAAVASWPMPGARPAGRRIPDDEGPPSTPDRGAQDTDPGPA